MRIPVDLYILKMEQKHIKLFTRFEFIQVLQLALVLTLFAIVRPPLL